MTPRKIHIEGYIESEAYYPSLISHGELFLKSGKISKARNKFIKILQSGAGYDFKAESNYLLGDLSEQQGYANDATNYYSTVRNICYTILYTE